MAEVNVQAQWILNELDIPTPANQTLVQLVSPGEGAYVSFGHVNPPVIAGLEPGTELTQDMVEGRILPVVPTARVLISIPQLIALRDKIDDALKAAGVTT